MHITFGQRSKKFEISCTIRENSLIADMPNKRFQKRLGLWHAPALTRNVAFMLSNLRQHMDAAALAKAEEVQALTVVKPEPFPAWYPFKTAPFKHQMTALNHAWGLPAYAWFMEMGTGKSKTACDLHAAKFMDGQITAWLVICPSAIRDNWADEIRTHFPLTDIPVFVPADLDARKITRLQKEAEKHQRIIVVAGVEGLSQKHRGGHLFNAIMQLIGDRKYAMTVDESHTCKSPDAVRSVNVEEFRPYAKSVGIMTGTPIGLNILDLYQQFQIMDPNIIGIGDFYSFRNRYAEMGGYEGKQIIGFRNVEELMGLVKPYVFQCTKAEVLDLPDKTYTKRTVEMAPEQEKVYKEVKKQAEVMARDMARQGTPVELIVDSVLLKYNAMQQITGGFVNHYEDSLDEFGEEKRIRKTAWLVEPSRNPKVRELLNIADETGDKKIIVWAKFRNEIAIIAEALRERYGQDSVAEYHGGVPRETRAEELARFKTGSARFFVANQKTGGTGLTVNESHTVVYFSNTLVLIERLQSEDRNHRIGQKNPVLYIDLVCRGTKDEDILTSIRLKKDVAQYVAEELGAPQVSRETMTLEMSQLPYNTHSLA